MASTVLGKRTRSRKEPEAEIPTKRIRRSGRAAGVPEDGPVSVLEDKENSFSILDDGSVDEGSLVKTSFRSTSKYGVAPVTPQTPRHYDAFAKSTSTPRRRVMSAGKLSRRLTPQTPLTPTSSQTIYHVARQLFSRSADGGPLVGREEEHTKLRTFLDRCATSQPGGCIYVSGPPGTGKSAMVNKVSQDIASELTAVRKAYINCMSIRSSKDLYATLADQLSSETDLSENDAAAVLQKMFCPRKRTQDVFLVVLDEIDHILSMDLESLYRVFEWSLQKTSRLALVGIANALDLTDRLLPRLKSRNLKPELVPFLPYTAAQIKNIIVSKLQSLGPRSDQSRDSIPFFHPAAIELCSRKVATQTGDVRRTFEICRRALDVVESETRLKLENEVKERLLLMSPSRKVLGENANLASGSSAPTSENLASSLNRSLQALTVDTAPRVSIAHLNRVTAAAFSNGTNQRLKTLNLQQKAALSALVALERRNREASGTPSKTRATAPTVKMLFETYCLLCTRDSILHPLSSSEFREVIGSLETMALVAAVDGKSGSFAAQRARKTGGFGGASVDDRRLASCVADKDMDQAVEGHGAGILKSILSGEALD